MTDTASADTATVTSAGTTKPAKGTIQSLERASMLLDAVAAGGARGVGLTEMADATGLHISTVFHLAKTLEALGYLARLGEGKAYFIGPRIFALAAGAPQFQALALAGRPVLDALSAETGEASHLAVRTGGKVLMVAQADARGMLQIARTMGQERPAHATAIGKVLLAACDSEQRREILAELRYERFTANTICDAGAFAAEIEEVRRQGHAEDNAELDDDIRCLAVCVPAFGGRLSVAIGLSGPVWRMGADVRAAHLATLRRYAAELEARLAGGDTQSV